MFKMLVSQSSHTYADQVEDAQQILCDAHRHSALHTDHTCAQDGEVMQPLLSNA